MSFLTRLIYSPFANFISVDFLSSSLRYFAVYETLSRSPIHPQGGGGLQSKPLRLPLQPLPRPLALVAVEKRFRLLTDLGVIGVDPVELGRGEEGEVEETAAEGHHGDVLEAEVGFVPEGVLGVGFAGHDDVWKGGKLVCGHWGKGL